MFRRILLLIAIIAVISILGCVSTKFVPDENTEKWIGKTTGIAKGELELFIKQIQDEKKFSSVSGHFVMKFETTGGYGSAIATGNIKGEIKNGIMNAEINGTGQADLGSSPISGVMIGTISKTQASGTWRISHREETLSGKWTAKKITE